MKRFENAKITLFDSTNANFRLAVEAQFVRGNRETGYRDLVYITDKATAILNPNIYLTLAYKGEDLTPVYTSYPQLYKLRGALSQVKKMIDDGAFIEKDGELFVGSNYEEAVVISNIGKSNNWISFKLGVIKSGENGVTECIPGVSIELSTSDRYASVLTVDEFMTIYTIIQDLNLADLQCMMSLAFLNGQPAQPMMQGQYYQAPVQPVPQPQYQTPVYPQYQGQPAYQQQTGYIKPRYNGNTSSYRAPQPQGGQPQQTYRTAQPQQRIVQQAPMTPEESAKADAENWLSRNPVIPEATKQTLPPRTSGQPVLNFKNVEDTPVDMYDANFDDSDALDAIFNE